MPRPFSIAALGLSLVGAAPPPDGDLTYSPWFRKLADPETTLSCCDESDCRYVEERIAPGGHEVLVGDRWLAVPEGKIIRDQANPTGRAVLCWNRVLGVMCFVPGPGM